MSDTRTRMMERIEKLLRMSRDTKGASESEIMTALKAARSLMTQLGIEECDLEMDDNARSATVEKTEAVVKSELLKWEQIVIVAVSRITDTRGVTVCMGRRFKVVFYGVGSDSQLAAELYRALIVAIRSAARLNGFRDTSGKRAAYRSYCYGYSCGLCDKAATAQAAAALQLGAMVIHKGAAIKKHLEKTAPDLRTTKSTKSRVDTAAFTMGKKDGRRADLGSKKIN